MISKDQITEKIDDALEEFYEYDGPIIDLTKPKTFAIASLISILCGVMIGFGYHMIFTSIDCSNVIYSLSGQSQQICFPNEWEPHRITIMIVTLIAGIIVGASPRLVKIYHDRME